MKAIIRPSLIPFYLILFSIEVLIAQNKPEQFDLSTSIRFEENKGQVADMNGVVQNDILFTDHERQRHYPVLQEKWYFISVELFTTVIKYSLPNKRGNRLAC